MAEEKIRVIIIECKNEKIKESLDKLITHCRKENLDEKSRDYIVMSEWLNKNEAASKHFKVIEELIKK